MAKLPKTPPISRTTKLLSFDLETNGLHGEAFAVGAVVVDAENKIHDQFSGRAKILGPIDAWVKTNVLPVIEDIPVTYNSARDLREAFWAWYLKAEPKTDYVLVSNGYPVEYRFLLQCQEENLEERYWQHPFPILDLTSLLIQTGQEPSDKSQARAAIIKEGNFSRHHPMHDAKISAMTAFEAFKLAGRLE